MTAVAPIQKSKAKSGRRAGGPGGKPIRVRLSTHADPPEQRVCGSYVLAGSIPLIVAGREIVCRGDEKVRLDDIWESLGSPEGMEPRDWALKSSHRYTDGIISDVDDGWSAVRDRFLHSRLVVNVDWRLGLVYAALASGPDIISISESLAEKVVRRTYGNIGFELPDDRPCGEPGGRIVAGDWRVRYAGQESVVDALDELRVQTLCRDEAFASMTGVSPRDYLALRGLPLDRDFVEHLPDEDAQYLGFAMRVASRFCREGHFDGVTERLETFRDAGRFLADMYYLFCDFESPEIGGDFDQ